MECHWQMIWAQRPFPEIDGVEVPAMFLESRSQWHRLKTDAAGVPLGGSRPSWTLKILKPSEAHWWQRKEATPQIAGGGVGGLDGHPLENSHSTGCHVRFITGESGRAAVWAWLDSRAWEAIADTGGISGDPREISLFVNWFVPGHGGAVELDWAAALWLGSSWGLPLTHSLPADEGGNGLWRQNDNILWNASQPLKTMLEKTI